MCDCINRANEQLKRHNTELDVEIVLQSHLALRTKVSTSVLRGMKIKRGQKPMSLVATYCPFCGQKYGE